MTKILNLQKSLFELVREHPDIANIMHELGFKDIVKPAMLNTAGRVMTIPKGAALKKIDLDTIKQTFQEKGYIIKN
ncbi:conserved hypothetical protein [Desulforamulus reducens MI-1]|uniref:DUF1858 domain-containing protein n=1 Tax=Desulforamulus reducens (strain ATCC BAA-1160 / DSM 100696 / MI-1) TaxID=349161 RepID=A4J4X9_DESRM|nr:DUF1858 domain-containing protein [Desulforamulus reducens]ABO50132.1 conserved hypothetical protein [Desulforamulus reducens MI-1]